MVIYSKVLKTQNVNIMQMKKQMNVILFVKINRLVQYFWVTLTFT